MVHRCHKLPAEVNRFLPFVIHSDRLYSYRTLEGLQQAINIMSRVSSLPSKSDYAIQVLKENYSFFNDQFVLFFSEIIDYISTEYQIIIE
jgi:acyl carrier protein phosphodiesterase